MAADTIRLTRRELYDLVWSEPMRTLAARYAVSDVGLAKACRRMKVPVPGRGYWRRKATGHPVIQERLPALPASAGADLREIVLTARADEVLAAVDVAGAGGFTVDAPPPATPTDRQAAYEADPAHRILVADTLEAAAPLHPLVRQTQAALRRAKPLDRGLIRPVIADVEVVGAARGRRPASAGALDVLVTPASVDRALRVLDALVKALETRGYPVACSPGSGRQPYGGFAAQYSANLQTAQHGPHMTRVEVGDEDVLLTLREVVSRVERVPEPPPAPARRGRAFLPPAPSYVFKEYDFIGTGRFALTIPSQPTGAYAHWTWEESKKRKRLEDALGDIVVGIVAAADAFRARREAAAVRVREEQARAQRQYEEQRQRAAEAARVQELDQQLAALAKAHQIRAYTAALRTAGAGADGALPTGPLLDWVVWAEGYADRIDPMRRATVTPVLPKPPG